MMCSDWMTLIVVVLVSGQQSQQSINSLSLSQTESNQDKQFAVVCSERHAKVGFNVETLIVDDIRRYIFCPRIAIVIINLRQGTCRSMHFRS